MANSDPDLVEMQLRDCVDDSEPDIEISEQLRSSSGDAVPDMENSEPPPLPLISKQKKVVVLSVKPRQKHPDPSDDRFNSSHDEPKRVTVENHFSNVSSKLSRNLSNSGKESFSVVPRRNNPDDRDISSFQEQKHWISSVLTAASAAGEETVQFQFSEDKHLSEGCGACGPDFSDQDFELSPDGFQSPLAAQIWRSNRSCLWLQSSCWKFYNSKCFKWLFRGNDGDYPKIEPAQKFRCGWKMLQERGCVLAFLFLVLLIVCLAAFPAFLRFANYIQIACVDYTKIQKFTVSCNGCKIQITNHNDWAGWFAPCNVNLFFPTDASFDTPHTLNGGNFYRCNPGLTPPFCDYSTGSCSLQIQHRSETVSFSSIENLLSMETQDYLVCRSRHEKKHNLPCLFHTHGFKSNHVILS